MNWKAQRQEELDFLGLTLTDHRGGYSMICQCPDTDGSPPSSDCPTVVVFLSSRSRKAVESWIQGAMYGYLRWS